MTSRARAAGLLLALSGCLSAHEGSGRDIDAGTGATDASVRCGDLPACTAGEDPQCHCDRCTQVDFECDLTARRYTTEDGDPAECVPAPTQVESGFQHTCVRWSNGRVSCWGSDCRGQLGDLDTVGDCDIENPPRSLAPVTVQAADGDGPLENVAEIATAFTATCARLDDRTVWCWGDNASGQIGDGVPGPRARPSQVVDVGGLPLANMSSLAAGGHHVCALDLAGTAWCWGNDDYGQLAAPGWAGPGDMRDKADRTFGGPYTALSAGGGHTCSIIGSGTSSETWCWGRNNLGQLGYSDDTADTTSPVKVIRENDTELKGVVRLGMGNNFSCAGAFPFSFWCWGENKRHALGDEADPMGADGTTAHKARESSFTPATDVEEVGAGDDFACARLQNGDVHCWGGNTYGQIGVGSGASYLPPTLVLGDTEALAVGFSEACVITSDRRVLCWGANDNGQLGDGTEVNRDEPTEVRDLCQ